MQPQQHIQILERRTALLLRFACFASSSDMYSDTVPGRYRYCMRMYQRVSTFLLDLWPALANCSMLETPHNEFSIADNMKTICHRRSTRTSLGASLFMVFSDSHHTAAPATGTESAASVHHSASLRASGELKIVRRSRRPSVLLISGFSQWHQGTVALKTCNYAGLNQDSDDYITEM